MPVNTLNNKKTNNIKESLAELLSQLKEQRRIATDIQPYMYSGDGLGPYVCVGVVALNKGINELINLNADFESVDDFDSVKKLRETEIFFLNTDGLKDFKFPDYKSQINPIFLMYVEIELQLDTFDKKAIDLLHRGYKSAGEEASWVVLNLRNLNQWFFQDKKFNYDYYQSRALDVINQSRPELEKHRGYKEILVNLILFITTLGMALGINKVVNGHFLFFQKTDSAKQLDEISQTLTAAKHLSLLS